MPADFGTRRATTLALENGPARCLELSADAGLVGLLFVAPAFMGGRHPLGEFIFVALMVVIAIAWLARGCLQAAGGRWRRSAEWLVVAAVAVVCLQLAPLPAGVHQMLSPRLVELLPLWNASAGNPGLGQWSQATVAPDSTRAALVVLLAYGMLFLVVLQRLERLTDVQRLLQLIGWSCAAMAVVGLAQYATADGRFLWIYQHPDPTRSSIDAVKGPFINKNHFAHVMALGLVPLLLAAQTAGSRRRDAFGGASAVSGWSPAAVAPWLALGLVAFGGLLTLSRGGAAAMLVAAAVGLCGLYRAEMLRGRTVVGLAGAFGVSAALLGLHGYSRVAERLSDYTTGSVTDLDAIGARRAIWSADAEAARDFWRLGSGAGTHRDIYPTYYSKPSETEFTHAENGYLQIALENGLPGAVLLAAALALCGWWCVGTLGRPASHEHALTAGAAAAGLAASAVHSLVDFVWYIPACMTPTVLLAACACRTWQLNRGPAATPAGSIVVGRRTLATALVLVALTGSWMIANRLAAAMAAPHWDRYLAYALSPPGAVDWLHPDPQIIDELERVVRWTPHDGPARLRLAQLYLRRFAQAQQDSPNDMPLDQLADGALQSRFATRGELDAWLARAVGPHAKYLYRALEHARRGVQSAPLRGEGYAYLAELCFLEGPRREAKPAYIAQALAARPYNGEVLALAGSSAALAGDVQQAMNYWRQALRTNHETRTLLVDSLVAHRVPAQVVVQFLEPELPALRLLYPRYSDSGLPPAEIRPLLAYYGQVGQREASRLGPADAAPIWFELHRVFRDLKQLDRMLDALTHAVAGNPLDFATRRAAALALYEAGQYAAARDHLSWCAQRRPDDRELQEALARTVKQQLTVAEAGGETARQ